jgi:hypothetical protein
LTRAFSSAAIPQEAWSSQIAAIIVRIEPRLEEIHRCQPGGMVRIDSAAFCASSSHRLMRIFGSIVLSQPLVMRASQSQAPECAGVRARNQGARGREPLFAPDLAAGPAVSEKDQKF